MNQLRVGRLVSAVLTGPDSVAAFRADPEASFARFELDEAERDCLRKPSLESLAQVGVHPLQRYRLLLILKGAPAGRSPMSYYLDRLDG